MEATRSNGLDNFRHNRPSDYDLDPRNLLAMNMVRCMNCSKYFRLEEIDEHLKIHERVLGFEQPHIFPSDRQPNIIDIDRPKPAKFQDLTEALTNETRSVSGTSHKGNFDIHTMLPEEMPTTDNIRKAIQKPGRVDFISDKVGRVEQSTQSESYTRPGSHINADMDIPQIGVLREAPRVDDYFEPININQISMSIVPKNISIYNNHTQVDVDKHISKRINPSRYEETQKKPTYKAIAVHRSQQSDKNSDTKTIIPNDNIPQSRKKFTIEDDGIVDVDEQPVKISTRGKKNIGGDTKLGKPAESRIIDSDGNEVDGRKKSGGICSWFSLCGRSTQTQEEHQISQINTKKIAHFTCPACGGFFCPVCKSTIPPQYRPPPGIKEYLEHSRQTHITNRSFYHG